MATNDQNRIDDTQSVTSSQTSSKIIKQRVLNLANELLRICKSDPNNSALRSSLSDLIPNQITSLRQLKSNLFVFFYENICSTELIDKKWPCKSQEDEIHNLQSVIDSLSLDVLHEDLSHLTAEAILGAGLNSKPDLISVEYLLDILKCIHEWITSKTEPSINVTQNTSYVTERDTTLLKDNKYPNTDRKIENIDLYKIEQKIESINRLVENTFQEEEDIFRNYMKEKEIEYNLNKSKRLADDIEFVKSSSGNSSLLSSNSSLMVNSINDEILNLAINLNQENSRHVKFQIDTRTRSNSPGFKTEHAQLVNNKPTRRKVVQIKDSSNIQTTENELEQIRNNLKNNLNIESNKIDRLLKNIYSEDLKDAEALMQSSLKKIKNRSDVTNQLYLNAHSQDKFMSSNRKKHTKLIASARSRSKGVLLPRSRSLCNIAPIKRSSSLTSLNSSRDIENRWSSLTQRSLALSKDPAKKFYSRFTIGEDGILNCLLQEFPYLYTSPETIHYLWQRHSKQIETLTKAQKEIEQKYMNKATGGLIEDGKSDSRAEHYLKEANRKQELLMDIMRKELEHLERQQDLKRKQLVENSLKAKTREQRFQNAKIKRYFEEFRLQQRAKLLKQKTSEELIFKKLFNESLKIQKERMLELKKYAKEKNEINVNQQMNQIVSIENFYKSKFDLLNEQIKKEKEEAQIRESAQHTVLNKMKHQVKNKLETDIRDLQDQMCRDKDFLYWRELDADRIKKDISKASYFRPTSAK